MAFLFTLGGGALKGEDVLKEGPEAWRAGIVGAVVVSLVLIVYQVADPPITALGYCPSRNRWLNVKELSALHRSVCCTGAAGHRTTAWDSGCTTRGALVLCQHRAARGAQEEFSSEMSGVAR